MSIRPPMISSAICPILRLDMPEQRRKFPASRSIRFIQMPDAPIPLQIKLHDLRIALSQLAIQLPRNPQIKNPPRLHLQMKFRLLRRKRLPRIPRANRPQKLNAKRRAGATFASLITPDPSFSSTSRFTSSRK